MSGTLGPLKGWRVLEVSQGVAAAFCAKVLADLGADVAMVEPASGHPLRSAEPRRGDGLSARFVYLSTGKRSVVVDDGDDERLQALVRDADVLVSDLAPARLDLLLGAVPDLVVVGIRPFGATGPYADLPAHHLTLFHAAGEGSTLPSGPGWQLFPERAPLQLGSDVAYFDAGWNGAVAALAACIDRLRSGTAPRVDVSVHESELSLSRTRMSRFNNDGVTVGREPSRYGITGMLRCADGWAEVVGMRADHWDRLLSLPEGEVFREERFATSEARAENMAALGEVLHAWCAARPKVEVTRILAGVSAPAGIFSDPADLLASEQLAHRRFFRQVDDGHGEPLTIPGAPYRFSRTPVAPAHAPAVGSADGFGQRQPLTIVPGLPRGRLLEGVRVLDFTWAAAGPYATLLLALLGADVLKIETSRRPDPARKGFIADYGGTNKSPNFNELNLNKRSFQVDLTQPEGIAIVKELVSRVDVVVDNFRPGVMEKFGLGAATLLGQHPHLVVASSSANGSTGPDAMGAGLASIFAASGGLSVQSGYRDGPPTEVADTMDYRSGAVLAVGILAAFLHRACTGEGQHVDVSSCEVVVASAPDAVLAHAAGVPWEPRVGNEHRTMAPHDVYRCVEGGWVAIAVGGDDEWAALCKVLGRDGWGRGYPTSADRQRAKATIDEAIAEWTSSRAAGEVAAVLRAGGVSAMPVMSFVALAEDPHLAERGVFVEVEHPEIGRQRVMRAPWLFTGVECGICRAGPLLGADNDSVLRELGDSVPAVGADRAAEVFR